MTTTNEEKRIKVVNGEGQVTYVPELIANDEAALKRLLASFYGTDNFRFDRKEENGETVIHVVKMAGTKGGASAPLAVLKKRQGGQNPVILLYQELGDRVDLLGLPADQVIEIQARVQAALEEGGRQAECLLGARRRLMQAAPAPAPVAVPGF